MNEEIMVRRVKVDRSRDSVDMIMATGYTKFLMPLEFSMEVFESMPQGNGEEAEVHLFKVPKMGNRWEQYAQQGMKPVDPYTLAALVEADPEFAASAAVTTIWKDAAGKEYYLSFSVNGRGEKCASFAQGRLVMTEGMLAGFPAKAA